MNRNNITLIKVFDCDYEYEYEQYFLVKNEIEKLHELSDIMENARRLDNDERFDKYNSESLIEIAEKYIKNNLQVINCDRFDIDCYY